MKSYQILTLLGLSLFTWACKQSDPAAQTQESSALDTFYQEESLSDAKHISEIFADPTPGKEVVIQGEIMGRISPFAEERALVVIGDPTKITPCNRIPGDLCPTPWDVCCDDPNVIKKSISTIQFRDSEGSIIKQGIKGYKGIDELTFLTVKGTISESSNAENLVIDALAFHITDPSPFKGADPVGLEGGTITEEDGVFIYTKDPEPKPDTSKKD